MCNIRDLDGQIVIKYNTTEIGSYSPYYVRPWCDVTRTQGGRLHYLSGMSDSRLVSRMLLGSPHRADRTGSNSKNTYSGREAGTSDQASTLPKADGAGLYDAYAELMGVYDYIRITGGVSK